MSPVQTCSEVEVCVYATKIGSLQTTVLLFFSFFQLKDRVFIDYSIGFFG